MSIIYEALKKVEGRNPSKAVGEGGMVNDKGANIKKYSKKSLFVLMVILIITAGAFIGQKQGYLFSGGNAELRARKISILKKKILKPVAFVNKASGRHVLEGIIYDVESPSAIINGKVLKKSDQIDEFTVIDITQNTVQLIDKKKGTSLNLSLLF